MFCLLADINILLLLLLVVWQWNTVSFICFCIFVIFVHSALCEANCRQFKWPSGHSVVKNCFDFKAEVFSLPALGASFRIPQSETSLYCKTTDTRPVYRVVWLLTPQLTLVLTALTNWVDLGRLVHTCVIYGYPSQH